MRFRPARRRPVLQRPRLRADRRHRCRRSSTCPASRVIADTGSVYVSGQPSEAALRDLAAKGVKTIISVRTTTEMNNRAQVPVR
jgi:hypothetical protein